MPTLTFSFRDLSNLTGRRLTEEHLKSLLLYAKAELQGINGDEITVKFNDTNQPYLWSIEGLGRLFRGVLGKEKGIPKLKIEKQNYKIIVDSSVKSIRPYIAAFVAKGKKIDDYFLKQAIQLQEKLCEHYGRRRLKVAIGIYRLNKIEFPVTYKATTPESVRFVPLDFKKEMSQQEIIEEHPKGKEYAWIVKGAAKYPILMDSRQQVLSFPPIINSATTGKLEIGDQDIFFEATGTDQNAVFLATGIFAQAFYERGFRVYSVQVNYGGSVVVTPRIKQEKIRLKSEAIRSLLGIELRNSEVKSLLEKARYKCDGNYVEIPHYRADILHPCDIVEDVGIMYGYERITPLPITEFTIGSALPIVHFINNIRTLMAGLGYQELTSAILSNRFTFCDKMAIKDSDSVEVQNFVSHTYSAIRTWIAPVLIEALSKNKHVDYPQRIFEQGPVTLREGEKIADYEHLAVLSCHSNADYTEIKQVLDYLLRMLGVAYSIDEFEHGSFIQGRAAAVIANNKRIAFMGEIHPAVLQNFSLEMPVVALELNLSELYNLINPRRE